MLACEETGVRGKKERNKKKNMYEFFCIAEAEPEEMEMGDQNQLVSGDDMEVMPAAYSNRYVFLHLFFF